VWILYSPHSCVASNYPCFFAFLLFLFSSLARLPLSFFIVMWDRNRCYKEPMLRGTGQSSEGTGGNRRNREPFHFATGTIVFRYGHHFILFR
jgi:hypothetical protein